MRCKWDILKEVNPSLISSADVLTACHCDRCEHERKQDDEIRKLRKENKKLKG